MNAYLHRIQETQVVRPVKTVLLVDEGGGGYNKYLKYVVPITDGFFGVWVESPTAVHLGGCNFTFVDGHAIWLRYDRFNSLIYLPDGNPGP